jgi:hypothetical protein
MAAVEMDAGACFKCGIKKLWRRAVSIEKRRLPFFCGGKIDIEKYAFVSNILFCFCDII